MRRHVGYVLLLLGFSTAFVLAECWNEDVWIHIASGRWMLESGSFPTTYPFSWTGEDYRWIAYSWLPEVVYHLMAESLGLTSLTFLTVFLAASGFTALYAACLKESGALPSFLVMLLTFLGVCIFIQVRPQLLSFVCLALFVLIFRSAENSDSARVLWLLPPIMILWANSHIFFVMGWLIAGFYILKALYDGKDAKPYVLTFAAVLIVPLVNPYGFDLYLELPRIVKFGGGSWLTNFSGEFVPPSPEHWNVRAFIVLGVSFFLLSPGRVGAPYALLYALFVYLSLSKVKYFPYLAVIAAPEMARHLGLIMKDAFKRRPIPALRDSDVIIFGIAGAYLLYLFAVSTVNLQASGWSERDYPAEEARVVVEENLPGPVMNEMAYGGYLIWALHPRKVFSDTMVHVYPEKVLDDILILDRALPGWREVMDRRSPNTIIWRKASPLVELLLSSGWSMFYEGRYHVVMIKKV